MPTYESPAADADEAREALRGLAHATRSIDDPRDFYYVLGSLTSAVASLSQSLHQLAAFHKKESRSVWVGDDPRDERAATFQVSWELHRAGEILRHVSESLDSAHGAQSRITYAHRDFPPGAVSPSQSNDHGLSL